MLNKIEPAPMVTVGDDFSVLGKLFSNKQPAILTGATINAYLRDASGNQLIGSTAQSSTTVGANWALGLVVVIFPKSGTANVPVGDAYVEYQVTLNGVQQTYEPQQINVVAQGPGFVPQTLTPNEVALFFEMFGVPQSGSAYAASQITTLYGPAGEPYDCSALVKQLNAQCTAMKPPQVVRLRLRTKEWDNIGSTRQVIITKGANGTEGQLQHDEKQRKEIRKVCGNILGFWSPPGGFYMEKQRSAGGGGRIIR